MKINLQEIDNLSVGGQLTVSAYADSYGEGIKIFEADENPLHTTVLQQNGGEFYVWNKEWNGVVYIRGYDASGNAEHMAVFKNSGTTFYNTGVACLQTMGNGVYIKGATQSTSLITIDGAGFYTRVHQEGASIYFQANKTGVGNQNVFSIDPDGATNIYYAANKVFETTATGAGVISDSLGLEFGAGNDADIKYDGTDLVVTTDKVAASDFVIDCGTGKTLKLIEPVWDDLVIPTARIKLGGANPASEQAYRGGLVAAFSSTSDNYLYFTFQLPHRYKEGEDVHFHIHWTIPVSGSGVGAENVQWILTSSASSPIAGSPESFPVETTHSAFTVDVQNASANEHLVSDVATISGSSFKVSECIICSLHRNIGVANDYASDAYIVSIDLHYPIDTMGSRSEWTK